MQDSKKNKVSIKKLQSKLMEIQQAMQKYQIPVILAFEGLSGAGKGSLISKLLYPLDPRFFNVSTTSRITEEMQRRPYLWYYWTKTPEKGIMTVFDKTWHRHILSDGVSKMELTKKEEENFFTDVNAFERQLADDGTVIMKFFLKISKEEQKRRLTELSENPNTRWRVSEEDLEESKKYNKYVKEFENIIEKTNKDYSPWYIIDGDDIKESVVETMMIFIETLEKEIEKRKDSNRDKPKIVLDKDIKPILRNADPNKTLENENYKESLKHYQGKIKELVYKLYKKKKSVIIAYEGWDAAGKGGNIRRLTQEMDPRAYEVVPVAAPTKEEISHHYLWRFYKELPKSGHITIFDRTWYGRVAVERIEGYATPEEWNRAFNEINEMEKNLHNHDVAILKFWIHIDQDEQLRRFEARESDPLKQFKITDEDWRNRAKWSDYELAIDEMISKTSTDYAPWHIIESNCKKYARIKVLKIVTKALEDLLE